MHADATHSPIDVAILGGGLAGLTLGLQLRARFPDIDILILDRQSHPVPLATHKVGESTVEIGAHYLDSVLGLREHLLRNQLKKFGFRFFFSEGSQAIEQVLELGVSDYLFTPAYQLDRGILENFLGQRVREQGVRFLDGALVRDFSLGSDGALHTVSYEHAGQLHTVQSRWLIDASGRAGLIKRRLNLAQENAHDANAVWFRIGTRVDVEDWSQDAAWRNRCIPASRWRSTNHLVGKGYWVWLIPLSSGSHSIGIVADARTHPLATMNSFEKALTWLKQYQPQLAADIEAKRHLVQDFCCFRNFSYGCKQVFSSDRWALTGEAGVFLDPFYSPGTDFIAIANTYIVELIARDRAGEPPAGHARMFEQLYFSFYESTLSLYLDQYDLFGDPRVLPVKIIWDYAYYWGVLCQLYFQERLTNLRCLGRVLDLLNHSKQLNLSVQNLLRAWSQVSDKRSELAMHDQSKLAWFAELNRGLRDKLDDDAFVARIRATTAQLQMLAAEIVTLARAQHPTLDVSEVCALLDAQTLQAPGAAHYQALLFVAA